MINGNVDGIKNSVLQEMESLYDFEIDSDQFAPKEFLAILAKYTSMFNKEISVYISRDGDVLDITIGGQESVSLSDFRLRRNRERLSFVRCIHTHPDGTSRLSDVDRQALRSMRFDAMAAVGVKDGEANGICAAFLGPMVDNKHELFEVGPVSIRKIPQRDWMDEIMLSDQRVTQGQGLTNTLIEQERAILVSMDSQESLTELASLADTAGATVVAKVIQNKQKPDGATFIGSGKAQELSLTCQALNVDIAIFDDELTGAQIRNLEGILGVKIIDRTALILDIFAQRAASREGMLQVELAQLKYKLPRLTGLGVAMSRLGGGIGTRGPGETKLEVDRRRIRSRINDLEKSLKEVVRQREVRRAKREKGTLPVVALVGYTNSGKSTLLNKLSDAGVLAEDKLFATLDTVTRKIDLPSNRQCLLIDTVGFINKLPHDLVNAFHSTLEEALIADLLIIVSDIASPAYEQQRRVVAEVLEQLGAANKPIVEVLNKSDKLGFDVPPIPNSVAISAKSGQGIDELLNLVSEKVATLTARVKIKVPYTLGVALSMLHDYCIVISEEYEADGTVVVAEVDAVMMGRVSRIVGSEAIELL